jgi:hypothetical protein
MASRERELLSAVDAAWLRMDSADNPMTITSVLVLDGPIEHARVEALLRERLLVEPRFCQRVVPSALPLGPPRWERDPSFDLRNHLHHVALPAPADEGALRDLVSDLVSTPLDRNHPLWQLHHVEGLREGAVFVSRLSHAIGDGVALVELLLTLTDEGASGDAEVVGVVPPGAHGPFALARQLGEQALALGRMLLLPSDPPSGIKGPLGARKRVAWTRPVPVDALKEAARLRSATLNDVLVATVAGALRAYLVRREALPDRMRALVPIYVRGRAAAGELGNHFGLVFVPLPIGIEGIDARIAAAKATMDDLKHAPDALVALGVLAAFGVASEELERIGVDVFTRKASLMVTNVPGPPAELHLAGRRLTTLVVWAPVSGHIGVGVSLLSYAGMVRMGVAADAGLVPDPEAITAAFEVLAERTIGGP